ncbi:MAG TPA: hypothetical protein VN841_22000 [Bryobacteraceae bacterium]|nr:hypothetical protein [Bryobacteraceae bacterium]
MTVAVKNKPPVVVPEAALRRAGFKRGQELEVKSASGVVTIVPRKPSDEDTVLTPAEAKLVRRGMKQIKEGRFKLWRDVKHELGR